MATGRTGEGTQHGEVGSATARREDTRGALRGSIHQTHWRMARGDTHALKCGRDSEQRTRVRQTSSFSVGVGGRPERGGGISGSRLAVVWPPSVSEWVAAAVQAELVGELAFLSPVRVDLLVFFLGGDGWRWAGLQLRRHRHQRLLQHHRRRDHRLLQHHYWRA